VRITREDRTLLTSWNMQLLILRMNGLDWDTEDRSVKAIRESSDWYADLTPVEVRSLATRHPTQIRTSDMAWPLQANHLTDQDREVRRLLVVVQWLEILRTDVWELEDDIGRVGLDKYFLR
jgi:hypothetical protein